MGGREELLITEAESEVTRELEWIRAEINAYEKFAERIRQHSPRRDISDVKGVQTITTQGIQIANKGLISKPTSSLRKTTLTAYAETVFAVDHWQRAYADESVIESIRSEFSPELTTALTSTASSTEFLKTRLLEEAKNRREERETLLEKIKREKAHLQELKTEIEEITDQISDASDPENSFQIRLKRLETALDTLEETADIRQRQLRSNPLKESCVIPVVYDNLHTDYPILSVIGLIRDRIDTIEFRIWAGYTCSKFCS